MQTTRNHQKTVRRNVNKWLKLVASQWQVCPVAFEHMYQGSPQYNQVDEFGRLDVTQPIIQSTVPDDTYNESMFPPMSCHPRELALRGQSSVNMSILASVAPGTFIDDEGYFDPLKAIKWVSDQLYNPSLRKEDRAYQQLAELHDVLEKHVSNGSLPYLDICNHSIMHVIRVVDMLTPVAFPESQMHDQSASSGGIDTRRKRSYGMLRTGFAFAPPEYVEAGGTGARADTVVERSAKPFLTASGKLRATKGEVQAQRESYHQQTAVRMAMQAEEGDLLRGALIRNTLHGAKVEDTGAGIGLTAGVEATDCVGFPAYGIKLLSRGVFQTLKKQGALTDDMVSADAPASSDPITSAPANSKGLKRSELTEGTLTRGTINDLINSKLGKELITQRLTGWTDDASTRRTQLESIYGVEATMQNKLRRQVVRQAIEEHAHRSWGRPTSETFVAGSSGTDAAERAEQAQAVAAASGAPAPIVAGTGMLDDSDEEQCNEMQKADDPVEARNRSAAAASAIIEDSLTKGTCVLSGDILRNTKADDDEDKTTGEKASSSAITLKPPEPITFNPMASTLTSVLDLGYSLVSGGPPPPPALTGSMAMDVSAPDVAPATSEQPAVPMEEVVESVVDTAPAASDADATMVES